MEIKYKSCELDKRSTYIHTRGKAVSIKELADGEIIKPKEIVVYSDVNNKGEEVVVTSIIDENGAHYATNSPYFHDELMYIIELMDGEPFDIAIQKNVTKAGRVSVSCGLA